MNKNLADKIKEFLSKKLTTDTNDIEYLQKALKLLREVYNDVIVLKD